jgi:hypothetical protein
MLQQSLLLSLAIHQQKKLGNASSKKREREEKRKKDYLAQVFFRVFKV